MYKVILMLDKLFWNYEGGVKLTPRLPQKKLPSKSPALLGLTSVFAIYFEFSMSFQFNFFYSIKMCILLLLKCVKIPYVACKYLCCWFWNFLSHQVLIFYFPRFVFFITHKIQSLFLPYFFNFQYVSWGFTVWLNHFWG